MCVASPCRRLRALGRVARASAWVAIAVLSQVACTRERSHEILTIFFDGVPPLDAPRKRAERISGQFISEAQTGSAPRRLEMVQHAPYQKEECARCHPRELSFSLDEDFDRRGRCFNCHEHSAFKAKLDGYAYVHGPVAIRNCLACHDAHESRFPSLLVEAEPRLCFECHDRDAILSTDAHRGVDSCVRCHNPHGGDGRYFLSVAAASEARGGTDERPPRTQ